MYKRNRQPGRQADAYLTEELRLGISYGFLARRRDDIRRAYGMVSAAGVRFSASVRRFGKGFRGSWHPAACVRVLVFVCGGRGLFGFVEEWLIKGFLVGCVHTIGHGQKHKPWVGACLCMCLSLFVRVAVWACVCAGLCILFFHYFSLFIFPVLLPFPYCPYILFFFFFFNTIAEWDFEGTFLKNSTQKDVTLTTPTRWKSQSLILSLSSGFNPTVLHSKSVT